jgi:hypothetical protein
MINLDEEKQVNCLMLWGGKKKNTLND